jgi:hypothetical protein
MVAEHWRWLGDFHRYLAERLREVRRDHPAADQLDMARHACSTAMRVAKPGSSDLAGAQSCLASVRNLK